jgi:uncharacterized protein Yka (UPF0111/DUF47 family)
VTTRVLTQRQDVGRLTALILNLGLPVTVTVEKGKKRSAEQNNLQRLWCIEIAEQLGDQTAEQVRGEIKLRFGVPILRHGSEEFCEQYDRLIKSLPYEQKLDLMQEPIDFPVTRLMSVKQKREYLDTVNAYYSDKGVILTQPDGDAW